MGAVPTQKDMLEEHLKTAVFSLQNAYKSIVLAERISDIDAHAKLNDILGGMSIELRDMLAGPDGEIGLVEAAKIVEAQKE